VIPAVSADSGRWGLSRVRHRGVLRAPFANPDGYYVDVRRLDPGPFNIGTILPFDGQNWERHAKGLAALSKAPSGGGS
jgi:hypothetical protein